MSRSNPRALVERVTAAAEESLAAEHYVRPLDVFGAIGWLYPGAENLWRQGRVDCIEEALQTSPARIAEAMELLRSWAAGKGLQASETEYVARTAQRQTLRFSRSGDPTIEQQYRTHWVSPKLSANKRERLAEKASRPPELVVIQPLNDKWTCHRCGGTGDLLMMEKAGPACLRCLGLGDLEFLASGDALLTRLAKAKSGRHAVVVRFSKNRRRYERQGLLLEPPALAAAQREVEEKRRVRS